MSEEVSRRYYVARSPRLYRAMADALEQRAAVRARRLEFCEQLGATGLLGFPGEAPTDLLYGDLHCNRMLGFYEPRKLSAEEAADFVPGKPTQWVHTPDPATAWGNAVLRKLATLIDVPVAQAVCRAMGADRYVVTPEKTHGTGAVFSDAFMVFAVPFKSTDTTGPERMPADLTETPPESAKRLWRVAGTKGAQPDE